MTYEIIVSGARIIGDVTVTLPRPKLMIVDELTDFPPRYEGTITYSTPDGNCGRRWFDLFRDWHNTSFIANYKPPRNELSSASPTVLHEYMPDAVHHPWDAMARYCYNDVKMVRDYNASYRQAMIYALDYDRRFHVIPPLRTFKDEPHWFKHDRKAHR